MKWNYRLFKYENDKENLIYISEAWYSKKGKLNSYVEPRDLFDKGFCRDNKKELKGQLELIVKCLKKPIIIIKRSGKIYEEKG